MTTQTKLVIAGTLAGVAAKFYFQRDTLTSIIAGLAIISAYAILTANSPDEMDS